jgi:Mg2+/citrate symporter
MTDVEEKRLKQQEVEAKIITQENKLLTTQNELNAKVELNRMAEYNEKVAKAESDQFTALSNQYDTEAQVNKFKINMLITVFVMTYIISEQLKMDILTVTSWNW